MQADKQFTDLLNNHALTKFSAAVSNPPYQRESVRSSGEGSTVTNVFHLIQETALQNATQSCMIYPGGRWIHGTGKGLKEFSNAAIHNGTLKTVLYYTEDEVKRDIFPGTHIRDGVSIAVHGVSRGENSTFMLNGIHVSPKQRLIPIGDASLIELIQHLSNWPSMEDSTAYHKRVKVSINKACDDERLKEITAETSLSSNCLKILINDIYGSSGRTKLFTLPEDLLVSDVENLPFWKLTTSTLQGREKPGDFKFKIADNQTVVSQSRIIFSLEATFEEANNKVSYLSTKLIQLLLSAAVKSRNGVGTNMATFVPDLKDYSSNNKHLQWDKPLDDQLYRIFSLTDEQIQYVESNSSAS